jgi:photosystem II stability/assembly factor-like uncharacterized protein
MNKIIEVFRRCLRSGTGRTAAGITLAVILIGGLQATVSLASSPAQPSVPADRSIEWQCWDDGTVDPCHHDLRSVDMISATEGWAVGGSGTILHWQNGAWSRVTSPTKYDLESVSMISTTDGWAGGWGGRILHWNGSIWELAPQLDQFVFLAMDMISATEGWAAGLQGIAHWNGGTWAQVASINNLYGVDMLSEKDGWAVGYGGAIYRWNGTTWVAVTSPSSESLNSISMVSETDGWIVGSNGTILRWNGSTWSAVASPTSNYLRSVRMLSATEGWAVGSYWDGTILHWNGSVWSQVLTTPYWPSSIDVTSASQVWVVGSGGLIMQYDEGKWTTLSHPTTSGLEAVQMISPTNGWTVGQRGTILHWDGVTWQSVASPTGNWLRSIDMISATDGWAIGTVGLTIHWDGSAWAVVNSPTSAWLNGTDMISATDGWAAGDNGAILRWNGSIWMNATSPTSNNLNSIKMVSSTDGWVVGDNSTILRWNGSAWTPVACPTSVNLTSIDMASSTEGWAVGWVPGSGQGIVLRWNDISWITLSQFGPNLWSVAVASPINGVTVGSGGFLSQWDGHNWISQATPTNLRLKSADIAGTDGWAVGENGIILVRREPREIHPIQQASITGPTVGTTATAYTFTASVSPLTATLPITYIWQADEQPTAVTTVNTTSHTISYTWSTPGIKTITLTATNEDSAVNTAQMITIVLPASIPILTSPPDGTITTSHQVALSWQVPAGSAADGYNLDLDGTIITTTQTFSTVVLPIGSHTWTVRSYNSAEYSAWAVPWSITVAPPASIPVLISPPNDTITTSHQVILSWQVGAGSTADGYNVDVDGTIITTTQSFSVVVLPVGSHTWTVRAYNVADYSAWAVPWSITVNPDHVYLPLILLTR